MTKLKAWLSDSMTIVVARWLFVIMLATVAIDLANNAVSLYKMVRP